MGSRGFVMGLVGWEKLRVVNSDWVYILRCWGFALLHAM